MNILDALKLKVLEYDPSLVQEWWGQAVTTDFSSRMPPMVEWDDYGCYILDLNHVAYVHYGLGRYYRVSPDTSQKEKDWSLHQKLYVKVMDHMKIKVDVPLDRKIVEINGQFYEYTETMFPVDSYGELLDDFYTYDIEDIIVTYKEMYKNLIEIYNENGMTGIPVLSYPKRSKHNDHTYFTINGQPWDTTPNEAIEAVINSFKKPIFNFSQSDIDRASLEWRSLL